MHANDMNNPKQESALQGMPGINLETYQFDQEYEWNLYGNFIYCLLCLSCEFTTVNDNDFAQNVKARGLSLPTTLITSTFRLASE